MFYFILFFIFIFIFLKCEGGVNPKFFKGKKKKKIVQSPSPIF
jgi:hypothetical protein